MSETKVVSKQVVQARLVLLDILCAWACPVFLMGCIVDFAASQACCHNGDEQCTARHEAATQKLTRQHERHSVHSHHQSCQQCTVDAVCCVTQSKTAYFQISSAS